MLETIWEPALILAAAATLLGGIARGFSGFGAAIIQAPLLALLFTPPQAVATMAALGTLGALQLVPGAFRRAHWRELAPLTLAALPCIPLGSLVLVRVDAELMRRGIAGIVLVLVLVLMSGVRYPGKPGPWSAAATGLVSGTLNGATGVGGPPVVLYFLAGPNAALTNRANMIVFYAFLNAGTAATLLWHGAYTGVVLTRIAVLWPIQVGALWLGAWLFRHASDAIYRRIALWLMLAVAVFSLLYRH